MNNAQSAIWKDVPADDDIPGYRIYTGPIHKPELDTREYRVLQLQNRLQVVLIHDANADKAAACAKIAVGHLQDPFDVPGLAHFCEHMITKGSAQFPVENDYLSYVESNGGSRNATTGPDWQDYWFSINPSQLGGGLARLAAFFHSPLFTASLTSREMYAVDSENKRNLQKDRRRILQLDKSLSVSGHPWTKFGTGNVASLTEAAKKKLEQEGVKVIDEEKPDGDGGPIGREVRRTLMEWWEREYCASRMSLAVIGKESIDELTSLVVPLFSPIRDRGLSPRPAFKEPIWGPEQRGTIVYVNTVLDYHAFELSFQIPNQAALFQTRPASSITHLLGHEGPGSICAYLKKKGWLIDLNAVTSHIRSKETLKIEGKLTREGYLHYKEVLLVVFNYISLVRSSTLEPYHFNEMAQMSAISFRFREKSQPHTHVRQLGLDMLEPYPPQELLSRGASNRQWDEPAVREHLDLMRPELGRVLLMAKNHDTTIVSEQDDWQKERWYGTDYRVEHLDEELVKQANEPNSNSELFLPRPNPYIPENLLVNKHTVSMPAKFPRRLRDTASSILWFKKDDQFWVPKARVRLNILSPLAYVTPRNAVLNCLLVELLADALSEITYDAHLAALDYSVEQKRTGLLISFGGYNDRLPVLVNTVVEKLKGLIVDPARFKVAVEKFSQTWANFYLAQPSELTQYYTSHLLSPISWSPKQKLEELPLITETDVDQYKKQLLSKIYIQALVTGNIEPEDSIQILENVERSLDSRALTSSETPLERSLLLPQGCNFTAVKRHANVKETNSALAYYCEFDDLENVQLRAVLKLLAHILKEPIFSQLRTVEQLGYVVASRIWASVGAMGFRIIIQSLKAPSYLEERVEEFITAYRIILANLTEEDLQAKKDALVLKLREAPKNLGEETGRFWYHIEQGYNDFLRDDTDAETIQTLKRTDILRAYDTYLMPSSAVRKKLSMHLVSQQLDETAQVIRDGISVIRDDDEVYFKRGLLWSAAATPAVLDTIPRYGTTVT